MQGGQRDAHRSHVCVDDFDEKAMAGLLDNVYPNPSEAILFSPNCLDYFLIRQVALEVKSPT